MELKVWCDGIQRVVCGVSAQTTCQDVVFALAHATAQTGRFILIERWRNSERLLAPSEHPLQVLAKWGEYANDVTLVMKRSEQHHKTNANTALNQTLSPQHSSAASPLSIGSPPAGGGSPSGLSSPQNRRDLINLINNNKSIYMSLNRKSAGLTQNSGSSLPSPTKPLTSTPINPNNSSNIVPNASPLKSNSCPNSSHNNTNSIAKPAIDSMANELTQLQMNNKNNNSVELTPTKTAPAGGQRPRHPPPYSEAIYQSTMISNSGQTNTISSHLVPTTDNTNTSNKRRSAEPSPQSQKQRTNGTNGGQKELILHRDAVRLVDMQKETMKGQEMEMSSLEQQIGSIEKRLVDNELLIKRYKDEMEACHQLWLDQEVLIDQLGDQSQLEQELDQLVATASACEDEMASLKKKLSQCETDIGDCRQKISKLMDELEENERVARDIVFDKEEKERELSEQLRTALRDKNCDLESQKNDLQILTNNIKQLDSLFVKKSEEIDRILADIKEENLQGLALQAATESPKYNAASSGQPFHQRSGSTRRMIGSPRELENAVATNKNPHGVWV